jgi:hypothetical protein
MTGARSRIQAARSPAEAFAEIGSHLILDPLARRYLPLELVNYFDTRVFSALDRAGLRP